MELITYPLLFITAFIASFIGVNVGGAGLLIVPVLIFLGLSPQVAVGTSRVMSFGMVPMGLWCFGREGKVNIKIGMSVAVVSILGAYAGARTLLIVPEELMEKLIGFFILILLPFILLKKNFGMRHQKDINLLHRFAGHALFFVVGFIAAFFGGGGQVIGTVILVSCFGMTFLEAAGTRKIAGLSFAVTALVVYIMADLIIWPYGLTLLVGGFLGSYFGSCCGLENGNKWVRRLFVAMMVVLVVKLIV